MAANPRKFSEKIALMRAKEAEADAAFHQILNEVSGITKTSDTVNYIKLKLKVNKSKTWF